jgi:hypothetical protein
MVANMLEYLPDVVVFENRVKRVAVCQIMTILVVQMKMKLRLSISPSDWCKINLGHLTVAFGRWVQLV